MKMKLKKFKSSRAFTLIEMLLVLLIISVLLILIIPNIAKQTEKVQETGCTAQTKMIDGQIEAYVLKNSRQPNSIDDLVSDGFINENQKTCKSGQAISIVDGKAVTQ